ncbi:hypothetical protein D3C76_1054840 [compost metagenome]
MPPNGAFASARPPIHRSMASTPVTVTALRSSAVPSTPSLPGRVTLAQAPLLLRKSMRSAGAPSPPNTRAMAAARFSSRVVALVMVLWVP